MALAEVFRQTSSMGIFFISAIFFATSSTKSGSFLCPRNGAGETAAFFAQGSATDDQSKPLISEVGLGCVALSSAYAHLSGIVIQHIKNGEKNGS